MTEEEWDAVIKVHLKGTFAPVTTPPSTGASGRRTGETNDARIINTTSVSGIYGNAGQTELRRGQGRHRRVHADRGDGARPLRRHRERDRPGRAHPHDRGPRHVRRDQGGSGTLAGSSPVVTWLASPLSADVTGQVIEASGRAGRRRRGLASWPEGRPDRGPARRRRHRPPPHRCRRPRHHHGRGPVAERALGGLQDLTNAAAPERSEGARSERKLRCRTGGSTRSHSAKLERAVVK